MISRRDFLARTGGFAALGAVGGAGFSQLACTGPQPKEGTMATASPETPPGPPQPFDLEVTITGLCLFWSPDPATSPPKQESQHILMVRPARNGIVEPHYPRVFYDAAYDSPVALGNYWRAVPLDDAILDLSGFRGTETDVRAVPNLLDISPHIPQRLDDPKKKNAPGLAGRVTLPPGVVQSDATPGWSLEGPNPEEGLLQAAWRVVWTTHDIPGPDLKWSLQSLTRGIPVESLTPLQPPPGSPRLIKLLISNVLREESSHEPPTGMQPPPCKTELKDFQAMRELYGGPPTWPRLVYKGTCIEGGPKGTPYTCLPSGGH